MLAQGRKHGEQRPFRKEIAGALRLAKRLRISVVRVEAEGWNEFEPLVRPDGAVSWL